MQPPPLAVTLSVIDRLEAAGLNVICDAKRLRKEAAATAAKQAAAATAAAIAAEAKEAAG
jgi:hypothetical protein